MTAESTVPGTGVGRRLLDLLFRRGEIESVEPVGRRMRLIRLGGVPGLSWTPGQQVRLNVGDLFSVRNWRRGPGDLRRSYSIWDYDAAAGRMDLYVLDHGEGPGARWGRTARPGQEVVFTGPEGKFVPRPAPYHLFAGEETASVAFGAMLRALPAADPVYGVVEVAEEADRLPLPRAGELEWRYRGSAGAASSASLVAAVRELDLPAEPGVAYLAGEARTIQAVRDHLVRDRGWSRRDVRTKPFWTPGKRGLE